MLLRPDRKTNKILNDLSRLSPGLWQVKVRHYLAQAAWPTAWHAAALLAREHPGDDHQNLWWTVHQSWLRHACGHADRVTATLLCASENVPFATPRHTELLLETALHFDPNQLIVLGLPALNQPDNLPDLLAQRVEAALAVRFLFGEAACQPEPQGRFGTLLKVARTALHAWCAGDHVAARQALTGLPFNSGFRDFAVILKSATAARPLEHQARISRRLASGSPFAPLWQTLCDAHGPSPSFTAYRAMPPWRKRLRAALRGLAPEHDQLLVCLQAADLDAAQRLHHLAAMHDNLTATHPDLATQLGDYARTLLPSLPPEPERDARWLKHPRDALALAAKRAEAGQDRFAAAEAWFQWADADPDDHENGSVAEQRGLRLLLEMEQSGFDCLSFGFSVRPRLEKQLAQRPADEATWLLLLDWQATTPAATKATPWLQRACAEQSDSAKVMRKAWAVATSAEVDPALWCCIGRQLLTLEPLAHDVRAGLLGGLQRLLIEGDKPAVAWLETMDACSMSVLDRALFHLYDHHFNPDENKPPLDWPALVAPLRTRPGDLLWWLNQASRLGEDPGHLGIGFDTRTEWTNHRLDSEELQALLDAWRARGCDHIHEPLMTAPARAWADQIAVVDAAGRLRGDWIRLVESALALSWLSLADNLLIAAEAHQSAYVWLLKGRLFLQQGRKIPGPLLQQLDDSLFEAVAHNQTELAGNIELFFAQLDEPI